MSFSNEELSKPVFANSSSSDNENDNHNHNHAARFKTSDSLTFSSYDHRYNDPSTTNTATTTNDSIISYSSILNEKSSLLSQRKNTATDKNVDYDTSKPVQTQMSKVQSRPQPQTNTSTNPSTTTTIDMNNSDDYSHSRSPTNNNNNSHPTKTGADNDTDITNTAPITSQYSNYFAVKLDNYFEITARHSSILTEIRGGTVAFLTLAYIILLNPHVLAASNIPVKYAASSTCLASAIASLICGIGGNLPVGCGPGVGLSAYFSYSMIPSILAENSAIRQPYLSGLFMTFLSGATVFLFTVVGVTPWLVKNIPQFLKISTIVGMGLFLAFVGMVELELVVANTGEGDAILSLGDMSSWLIWLALMNLLLISTLKYFQISGSLLVCIIFTTIVYFLIDDYVPSKWISMPVFLNPSLVFNVDQLTQLPLHTTIASMICFILILVLDVSGVTFGIARIAGLLVEQVDEQTGEKKYIVRGQKWALIGSGIGTMIAAMFGCSPIIICIETSSGAAAGSRTGFSAVVIAFYFLLAIFLGPIFGQVPSAATSPILIFIGVLMLKEVSQIPWDNMRIAMPAFLCITMMPFTYSISNGLFFGVAAYFCTWVATLQFQYLAIFDRCRSRSKMKKIMDEDADKSKRIMTFDEKYKYSNVVTMK